MKKWRKDNREHYRRYQKKWLRDNPAAVMYREWRRTGCCICGFNDWRAVVAHHIDPREKNVDVCFVTNAQRMAEELAKCVPLCANHHAIVHDELRHDHKGCSLSDVIESIQTEENA
jgi:phage FluMu gp28-like protein